MNKNVDVIGFDIETPYMFNSAWLRTNDVVPEPQRLHILNLLDDVQHELRELEAKISSTVKQQVLLEEERTRRLSHAQRLRMIVAPHRRLPPDILTEIFLCCLRHPRGASAIEIPVRCGQSSMPWVLAQICSKWRQIALSETRLWKNIVFNGALQTHLEMLDEAFLRCGKSMISFDAEQHYPELLCGIVLPHSHRFSHLSLILSPSTFAELLSQPAGLFSGLISVELISLEMDSVEIQAADCYVFQLAQCLRRITIAGSMDAIPSRVPHFPLFPLPLEFPWAQLTHIHLKTIMTHVLVALGILIRCTELCEGSFCLDDAEDEGLINKTLAMSAVESSTQLPHLKALDLCTSAYDKAYLYTHFLRRIKTPALRQFNLVLQSPGPDWSGAELTELLDSANHPDFRSELECTDDINIVEVVSSLSFVTTLKLWAPRALPASVLQFIGRSKCLPNLRSLVGYIRRSDVDAFVDMLRTRWQHSDQLSYRGPTWGTIYIAGGDEDLVSQVSTEIFNLKEELRIDEFGMELRALS